MVRFSGHLNSNCHKLSMKNKQCFKDMSNRNANVWQMEFNASLRSSETKNLFILKCFKITFLMIRKNWAHSQCCSIASTRACMWNIPPPFWKFPWCTFNITCKTKGSWSTRAVHSMLILSNNCNKFDASWCFEIYETADFIFSNK